MEGKKYDYKKVQQEDGVVISSDKSKSFCFILFVAFASSIITLQFIFIFTLYHPNYLLQFLDHFDIPHCPSSEKMSTKSREAFPILPPDRCPPCEEIASSPCEDISCPPCEITQDVAPCIFPQIANLKETEHFNTLPLEKIKKRPKCGVLWFFHITKTGGGSIADFLRKGTQNSKAIFVTFWNTIKDFWERDPDFQYKEIENRFKRVF
eukprot:UN25725